MNKKEKQEIGQSLIDLIYEVDGHIDTFLEEFIDWKYVKENIDVDKLTKKYDINYPTWSVLIQKNFHPSDDDADKGDAYTNFGIVKSEQVNFDGDGNDFTSTLIGKVEHIIDNRLNELTPENVKQIVQDMIREHLGWLVVWGGVFGGAIGMIVSLLG